MTLEIIQLDSYSPYWTTNAEGVRTQQKMHNVIQCDSCEKVMYDPLEIVYQLSIPHKVIMFFCSKCKHILER